MYFELGTDSLTIIYLNDENPLSDKNKRDIRQYLHGGVNVTGRKFSVGFVLESSINLRCIRYLMIPCLSMIQMDRVTWSIEYLGSICFRFIGKYVIYTLINCIN